jgi:hypothetical protein
MEKASVAENDQLKRRDAIVWRAWNVLGAFFQLTLAQNLSNEFPKYDFRMRAMASDESHDSATFFTRESVCHLNTLLDAIVPGK